MTQNSSMQPESLVGQASSQNLGMVVSGSLTEGMEVRLDSSTSIEDIKVGTFVRLPTCPTPSSPKLSPAPPRMGPSLSSRC